MDLKYSHVDILVSDLDKAVRYYKKLFGCKASKKQVWRRGDFHVEYVIMFKDNQRFFFVQPYSGNLKDLLDKKGEGTIYRFCFTTSDIRQAFRELAAAGVQPEDENGAPLAEDRLDSPAGTPIVWLPKVFGDLSMEILEEKSMEQRMGELRREAQ
jgi:methylmalonyl-CoA/ethylmalonyl-CoA epimerase